MNDLPDPLQSAARSFNEHLRMLLEKYPAEQPSLQRAIAHAVLGEGKRVRPLMTYAAARAVGDDSTTWLVPATAVEMIHAYSLVHDDLPAMDDDQWRRGQPTTHVVFGEAIAILAGDALQAMAFQVLTEPGLPGITDQQRVNWVGLLAMAAGQQGMVDGQAIDCHASSEQLLTDLSDLERMHQKKTGALIEAAVLMGGLCQYTSRSDPAMNQLRQYAQATGLAFQVVDDILDVTSDTATLGKDAGSDVAGNKLTYVSALGLSAARKKVEDLHRLAQDALADLPGDTTALHFIADFIISRVR